MDDGTYTNVQWVHGFSTERGDSLNDYLFGYVERTLFADDARIRLGGSIEFGSSTGDLAGFGLFPSVTYQAIDNLELTLGAFTLDGDAEEDGILGTWADTDQIYVRATVHF